MQKHPSLAALLTTLLLGCVNAPPEPPVYRSSGKIESRTELLSQERTSNNQSAAEYSAENARLVEELKQRGVDVRESDRGVVINLPDVLFASGRAELTTTAREIISEIAQILLRAPSRNLLIEGHTDSLGTIEYNYWLSQSRAQQVTDALESNGINRNQLTTTAFGETTPIATNRTNEGRRQNRRVEVVLVTPPSE